MLSSSLGRAGSVGTAVEVAARGCLPTFAPDLKVCASRYVLCSPPGGPCLGDLLARLCCLAGGLVLVALCWGKPLVSSAGHDEDDTASIVSLLEGLVELPPHTTTPLLGRNP
jgi:hypothetical protein